MVDIRAGVCIIENDKILLLQATEGKEDGQNGDWGPPGGHGEANETFEETAVREAKEEAGIDVVLTGLIQAALVDRSGKDILMLLYGAKTKGESKIELQKEEVQDFKWVTREEVEKETYPLRNKILKPVFLRAFDGVTGPVDSLVQIKL